MDNYTKVKEFHTKFKQPIDVGFDIDVLRSRKKMITEEVGELFTEYDLILWRDGVIKNTNKERLVKELCDVLYVVYGAFVELGVDVHEAMKRVHESNLSKLQPDGTVLKKDGKVIKPITYKKPSLTDLIVD
jgi:predicted HAD superfamily Cof-like phosphohydrolase